MNVLMMMAGGDPDREERRGRPMKSGNVKRASMALDPETLAAIEKIERHYRQFGAWARMTRSDLLAMVVRNAAEKLS
jgi:hypothetical protein